MKFQPDSVDLDLLPGLRDILPGEALVAKAKAPLAAIFKSLADPATPHDAKRKLQIVLGLTPEATHDSSQVRVKKLASVLPGPRPPKTSRLVLDSSGGRLRVVPRGDFAQESEEDGEPTVVLEVPELDELFEGELERAFQWELATLCLNLQDPRTERKAERTLQLELVFTTDETREVARLEVSKVTAKIAGAKKPEPSVLYLERDGDVLSVHAEAASILPSEDGPQVGRQSNVLEIKRS